MCEAQQRLSRLLGLVPFITANPGTQLEDLAAHFNVPVETIEDDLQLLFVSGRPGHMPDDLIDARWGPDGVFIDNAAEVDAPVRLSGAEASSLVVALDYLQAAHPDVAGIENLRAKLQSADRSAEPVVDVPAVPDDLRRALQSSSASGTPIVIDYYVTSRDELTRRVIRPHGLRLAGRWYLDAYCETSGGERTFSVDNIETAALADGAADIAPAPQKTEEPIDYRFGFASAAAWILDEFAFRDVEFDDAAGIAYGTITVLSQAWLDRQLLQWGRWIRSIDPVPGLANALGILKRVIEQGEAGEYTGGAR